MDDRDALCRAKGTMSTCENELRVSSWIRRVNSAIQTTRTTESTLVKAVRSPTSKMCRMFPFRRRTWRISCGSHRRGRKVRIGTASISWQNRRSSEVTGSPHPFGYMLSRDISPSSRAASSITDSVVPDYGDSSVYSSQLGFYHPDPPFEPFYASYMEQAIHHQGAYAMALHRLGSAYGKLDYITLSYSRP